MKVIKGGRCVILYECAGFGLILLLCALNNLLGLPHLLVGGEGAVTRWRYGVMETIIILLIWAFVLSITRRLLEKVHCLEGMLHMCGWCHKIGHGDEWMTLEDYLARGMKIETTHGICPDCRKRLEEDTRLFLRSHSPGDQQGRTA